MGKSAFICVYQWFPPGPDTPALDASLLRERKTMPNVLISARYFAVDPEPLEVLRAHRCELVHTELDWTLGDGNVSEGRTIELLHDVDAAVISSLLLTDRVLAHARTLKVIAIRGVGYDSVDIPAATARRIPVIVAPGFTDSVADYTFALMLAVTRQVALADRLVRDGRWEVLVSTNICGKTLGIVGLGRIGKAVARRARGFDMTVLATDLVQDDAFAQQYSVAYLPLPALVQRADIVSINAPLSGDTRHLIDEQALRLMQPTAFLINTARGGLVDEQALAAALREGRLAGAGLDVFEQEPLHHNPFQGLDNVVLSPHLAAYSREGLRDTGVLVAQGVVTVLGGGRPDPAVLVNPEVYA
ncbi:MAG TPA: phosphoglycerate dehydrogenase [Candidatus Tectomicrobia bacterium]|nr:phosphoglycerate dehydrogenase [Candidatus Tectomicrobia bacterium]